MKISICCLILLSFAIAATAQNVVQVEYFIDADAGFGKNTVITVSNPQPDGSYSFTINAGNVTTGHHRLYTRTKDSDGKWGITTRRNIEVVSPNAVKTIVMGEYFFDTDPGYNAGIAIAITPQDTRVQQSFAAATNSLAAGQHKIYTRVKDIDGKWSVTSRRTIEITDTTTKNITGAEYFFTTDAGIGSAMQVAFNNSISNGLFSFKIPIPNIPAGAYALAIRVKESTTGTYTITQLQTDSVVTTVQPGLWSDVNTWANKKIPVANAIVLLYHNVTVDIDATCKSLAPFGTGVTATVLADKKLIISGR